MDLVRQELLDLLAAIGVGLPKTTKMTNESLDKRLGQALDASQEFANVVETLPFNPGGLSTWPSSTHSKSLFEAVQRGNLVEAMQRMDFSNPASGQVVVGQQKTDNEETFMEVR